MTSHVARLALVVIVAMVFLFPNNARTIVAADATPEILMKQGSQAYQRGAFDQALGAWKQAAQVYEQQGKPAEQSRALVQAAQQGGSEEVSGEFDAATIERLRALGYVR